MELITKWTKLKINEAVKLHYGRQALMAQCSPAQHQLYY